MVATKDLEMNVQNLALGLPYVCAYCGSRHREFNQYCLLRYLNKKIVGMIKEGLTSEFDNKFISQQSPQYDCIVTDVYCVNSFVTPADIELFIKFDYTAKINLGDIGVHADSLSFTIEISLGAGYNSLVAETDKSRIKGKISELVELSRSKVTQAIEMLNQRLKVT